MGQKNLVLLGKFYDPTQAHIVRGKLETNDIPCFVFDDHHNNVAWHLSIALGGIRVMIFEEDLIKAQAVLSDHLEYINENKRIKRNMIKKPYLRTFFGTVMGMVIGAPSIRPVRKKNED